MLEDDDLPLGPDDDLSRDEVQHRIDDWLGRLDTLFQRSEEWARDHGWTVSRIGPTPMDEDLMRRHAMSPAEQPVLKLEGPDGAYALFKPKGLWVIGANGRVDLYTPKGAFILVDQADAFRAPEWRLFRASEKREGIPYGPELLSELT